MTENRFAQLRDAFEEGPKKERAVARSRKRAAQSAPKVMLKKDVTPLPCMKTSVMRNWKI